MKRLCAVSVVVVFIVAFGQSDPTLAGNITVEGPTGMFLNPTADERPAGTLLPQACWLHQDVGSGTFNAVLTMASYTFASNTEVGGLFFVADLPGADTKTAPGGFVRHILVTSTARRPAVAVGGVLLQKDPLTRKSLFAALRQRVTPERFSVPIFADLGGKWMFAGGDDHATVYGGVEVGVANALSVVAEIARKTKFERKTPFAFGIQYNPKPQVGLSLAALNPGNGGETGLFFGIGYAFTSD